MNDTDNKPSADAALETAPATPHPTPADQPQAEQPQAEHTEATPESAAAEAVAAESASPAPEPSDAASTESEGDKPSEAT